MTGVQWQSSLQHTTAQACRDELCSKLLCQFAREFKGDYSLFRRAPWSVQMCMTQVGGEALQT
jgi:hypothetical protein